MSNSIEKHPNFLMMISTIKDDPSTHLNDLLYEKLTTEGNANKLQHFINKGLNIFNRLNFCLEKACYEGHLDIVKVILKQIKKEKYSYDLVSESALNTACEKGHENIVKMLLNAGANAKSSTTAIYNANHYCHYNIVYLLHQYGAPLTLMLGDKVDMRPFAAVVNIYKEPHDLTSAKQWMAKNIIGLSIRELSSCKEKDLEIFIFALNLYMTKHELSLLSYLKNCPEWQKNHVLGLIAEVHS
jgi:ankyrin repeat protein